MLQHCIYVVLCFHVANINDYIDVRITHYITLFIFNLKIFYDIHNVLSESGNTCTRWPIDNIENNYDVLNTESSLK